MAKIIYDIYRNVKSGSVSEGRYFGRILQTETLNTAKLARHIAEHGSPYTQDVVEGVLRKAESCILELILDSKKIKIDGLGTFYITGENQKHGTISIAKFNPKTSFKGLHIRFLPDQATEANLSSRSVLNQASFIWAEDLKREKAEERPENSLTPDPSPQGEGSENSGSGNSGNGNSGNSGNSGDSGNSGSQTPTVPTLTISRSGSGSSAVTVGGNAVNSGSQIAAGTEVALSVTPAEGQTPTATLNGSSVTLTESDGTYTGTFQMPDGNATLVINSGSTGGGGGVDQN